MNIHPFKQDISIANKFSVLELINLIQQSNFQMRKATEYPKPSLEDRLAKVSSQRSYQRHFETLKARNQQQPRGEYGYRKHNSPDYNKYRAGGKESPRAKNNNQEEKELVWPNRRQEDQNRRRGKQLTKNASTPALNEHKQQLQEQNQDYKKLSEKLNLIESKIADMKRHVQKKRQEKQALLEAKRQREREREEQRKAQEESEDHHKASLKQFVSSVPEHTELHSFQKNPYSPKHNIYYISQIIKSYRDDKSLGRQHLLTSLHIFKVLQNSRFATQQQMKDRQVLLQRKPGSEGKKTVVFDLDQTLIHCNDTLTPPYDIKLPITFPTGEVIQAGINIRPHAQEILKNLSKHFEIIVFTASHSCYANVVLDYLDPNNQYIHHRLFREHCYQTPEGMYCKDLRVMNRDLSDLVLVDNAAYSYAAQPDNGIPILPYYHGRTDFQLKALQKYLMNLVMVKDVRAYNREIFQFHQYRNYYSNPQRLVQQLYMREQI